jgi:molybdopterin synthase catalytic subunit/molybdopterin converting factor small subunit
MKLNIRLFAGLAGTIGHSHITIHIEQSAITAGQLKTYLIEQYPHASEMISLSFIAKNQTYALADEILGEQDELACIPPVSGGETQSGNSLHHITYDPISIDVVSQLVIVPQHGAAINFVGTTREFTEGKRTVLLEYEAYMPMALAALEQISREIDKQWPGTLCAITHRIGQVAIGEISVVIAVSAKHRLECYEASRFAIERLKQIVPIWKKEIWEDGSEWKGHQKGPWDPTANPFAKDGFDHE